MSYAEKLYDWSLRWQLWLINKTMPNDPDKERKLEKFMNIAFGVCEKIAYFVAGIFVVLPDPRVLCVFLTIIVALVMLAMGIRARKQMYEAGSNKHKDAPNPQEGQEVG